MRSGVHVRVYPGLTHVKAALYDGWVCLGSANFDNLSLRIKPETNVATSDAWLAERLRRELLEADLAESKELLEPRFAGGAPAFPRTWPGSSSLRIAASPGTAEQGRWADPGLANNLATHQSQALRKQPAVAIRGVCQHFRPNHGDWYARSMRQSAPPRAPRFGPVRTATFAVLVAAGAVWHSTVRAQAAPLVTATALERDVCAADDAPPQTLTGGAPAADTAAGESVAAFLHVSRKGAAGTTTAARAATISGDGRYVAFEGGWTEFGSTSNSSTDVIVKDLRSGAITNAHRGNDGKPGISGSEAPALAANGSAVAFVSASSNLVPTQPSGALYDIYVAGIPGPSIERVSTGSGDVRAQGGRSGAPDISADSRYVVFESTVPNWLSGGSAAIVDIYVKDRVSRELQRASNGVAGGGGNADSTRPRISGDGRYVVFQSDASNLSADDSNGYGDVFLWDRNTSQLRNLTQGVQSRNPNNRSARPDVAAGATGAIVVFESARAFVPQDPNNATDVYALDVATGAFRLASAKADGSGAALGSEQASISGDGRYVAFTSYADDLVPGDNNGTRDVFVKDLATGAIARVSQNGAAANNQASLGAQISEDGRWVAFESGATNLAADANGTLPDVFRAANPLATAGVPRNGNAPLTTTAGTQTARSAVTTTLPEGIENLRLTGTDAVNGTGNALDNRLIGNEAANTLIGLGGNDLVYGCGGNDQLQGDDGNDRLDGGPGNDRMLGGAGDDVYLAGVATDLVFEAPNGGVDTVESAVSWTLGSTVENLTLTGSEPIRGTGNSGNNRLTGNEAANVLKGGSGDDQIDGRGGDDRLTGGRGDDQLTGGAGADTFVFDSDVGSDTVADFVAGLDRLQFRSDTVFLRIGNGDAVVDGARVAAGPGGFDTASEIVLFANEATSASAADAAAAIGSATTSYAVGDRRVFVIAAAGATRIYLFQASSAAAAVRAGDLSLVATVPGNARPGLADFSFTVSE